MYENHTPALIATMPAEQLAAIVDSTDESPRDRAAARAALVEKFSCRDCGAKAGSECKPDYGCLNKSRRPLQEGDRVRFAYLPLTAPEEVVGGVVQGDPWCDDDGEWLHIRDEFGILRTAKISEVVAG